MGAIGTAKTDVMLPPLDVSAYQHLSCLSADLRTYLQSHTAELQAKYHFSRLGERHERLNSRRLGGLAATQEGSIARFRIDDDE